MNTNNCEKDIYAFMIHDYIPDVLRGTAFRRARRFNDERQKIIKCPRCGKQLTAINPATKVILHKYSKKTDVLCHEYRKCSSCNETIGFIFTLG
ncbi:MAG: hypothetical protein FWD71_13895 [Oscillospiraceae bacterium]|nr:hypothetical protein [Oscillospiraceae bacterium]